LLIAGVEWGILGGMVGYRALMKVSGGEKEEGSKEEREGLVNGKRERRSSLRFEGDEDEAHYFNHMMDESERRGMSPLQVVSNAL